MGEVNSFFYDTYALFEIVHNNSNYSAYVKEIKILTTKLNLMELHYRMLMLYGKDSAEEVYNRFREFCIDVSDNTIKKANEFKLENKKRRVSYVDCIGYILAKENGVKFLTGDKEFKDLENVEFVK